MCIPEAVLGVVVRETTSDLCRMFCGMRSTQTCTAPSFSTTLYSVLLRTTDTAVGEEGRRGGGEEGRREGSSNEHRKSRRMSLQRG